MTHLLTKSITWRMMTWFRNEPRHQQLWYRSRIFQHQYRKVKLNQQSFCFCCWKWYNLDAHSVTYSHILIHNVACFSKCLKLSTWLHNHIISVEDITFVNTLNIYEARIRKGDDPCVPWCRNYALGVFSRLFHEKCVFLTITNQYLTQSADYLNKIFRNILCTFCAKNFLSSNHKRCMGEVILDTKKALFLSRDQWD